MTPGACPTTSRSTGRAVCADPCRRSSPGSPTPPQPRWPGELGPFPGYDKPTGTHMLRVIRNHRNWRPTATKADGYEKLCRSRRCGLDRGARAPTRRLAEHAARACLGPGSWSSASAHGYRNAQASVVAPTGTIGLVMDCDTTGIEPDFAVVKFKKLAGGGYFKIINRTVPEALRTLGYDEGQPSKPIIRLRRRPRHPAGCARRQSRSSESQGLHGGAAQCHRGATGDRVRHQVRVQQVVARP